jgi:hypothetical protein
MIRYGLILMSCLLLLAGNRFAMAQEAQAPLVAQAHFSVDASVFLLGDVLPIRLTVTMPTGFNWVDDVDFSAWGDWELVAYSEISETQSEATYTQYEQLFHVYAPGIGIYETPLTEIRYQSPVDGEIYPLQVTGVTLTVIEGQASFLAEEADLLVGQPVALQLIATLPLGAELLEWPSFEEDWGPFMLREIGEVTAQQGTDGRITRTQHFTALLWETGEQITPETAIQFSLEGVSTEVLVSQFHFNVLSVLDGTDEALRPLKAPVDLSYVPLWLVVVLAVLVLGGVFFGARIMPSSALGWQRQTHVDAVPLTPLQAALAQLQRATGEHISPVRTYAQVADVLRGYLQAQFSVDAQDMTTVEVVSALPERLPGSLVNDLQRLLNQADLVKFARYEPDKAAAERYAAFAQRWVVSAEKHRPVQDQDEVAL